jgi:antitoxin FitA
MSKMIRLRQVPDALLRQIKARAAKSRLSLSDYLIREMRKIAERPTLEEMRERLRGSGSLSRERLTKAFRAEQKSR